MGRGRAQGVRLTVAAAAISVLRIMGALGAVYVLLCVLAWRYQERLVFPRARAVLPDPPPPGRRVMVKARDGVVLHGWYLPPASAPERSASPGLIWFCGNMETIGGIGSVVQHFRPPEAAVLVLDYRGYGENEGVATESDVYQDAEAAWDFLTAQPEVDSARVVVYGRSVGSVPALYLATTRPVRGVILDSPFTSVRAMAAAHYRYLPRFIIRVSMDNLERAARLKVPLLVFHGDRDRLSPIAMGEAVAAAGHGRLVRLAGADHNATYDVPDGDYRRPLQEFFSQQTGTR